jgi:hypothetical protein
VLREACRAVVSRGSVAVCLDAAASDTRPRMRPVRVAFEFTIGEALPGPIVSGFMQ